MSMEEGAGQGRVKTLAIRLEPELHAQLVIIAQLQGSTITDEIRSAIEHHILAIKGSPELSAKAGAVLEEIERDANARRDAIAALFGNDTPPADKPSTRPTRKGRQEEAPLEG